MGPESVTTTTATGIGGIKPTGWAAQLLFAALTVISTWRLFAGEIHGYIDGQVNELRTEVAREVAEIGEGHMLMLSDSLAAMELRTGARLDAIEERMGLRAAPGTRLVVTAAPRDTAAQRKTDERLARIEQLLHALAQPQPRRR